jgi:PTH1 family peptidyl-tRNA hydrolase
VGFKVVDLLASRHSWRWIFEKLFNLEIAIGKIGDVEFRLLKPLTYMNLSGEAVKKYLDFHGLSVKHLIVIVDDADLKLGEIKMKSFGGTAGHKGLSSIRDNLQGTDFKRMRLGIGRPDCSETSLADYVLTAQGQEVWGLLSGSMELMSRYVENLAQETFEAVMHTANGDINGK